MGGPRWWLAHHCARRVASRASRHRLAGLLRLACVHEEAEGGREELPGAPGGRSATTTTEEELLRTTAGERVANQTSGQSAKKGRIGAGQWPGGLRRRFRRGGAHHRHQESQDTRERSPTARTAEEKEQAGSSQIEGGWTHETSSTCLGKEDTGHLEIHQERHGAPGRHKQQKRSQWPRPQNQQL
eukprot:scaffold17_cov354-Pavlova_lutheri.AAC.68